MISEPSFQSLFLRGKFQGQHIGTGTGFVAISPRGPVLITARHNVTGRDPQTGMPLRPYGGTPYPNDGIPDEIEIVHNHASGIGFWTHKTEPLFYDNKPRWIDHPVLGDLVDLVALPLTQLTGAELYPYDLTNVEKSINPKPGDKVSIVGFPFGLRVGGSFAIWNAGFIASEPELDFEDLPIFVIDCRCQRGHSGSPVIMHNNSTSTPNSKDSHLLGIYTGMIPRKTEEVEKTDIGIVWKTRAIHELVSSIR